MRDARAMHTRTAIIEAATAMFVENGYFATGVRDITARANVTSGALAHHFGSKEQLFLTIFDKLETEMLAQAHEYAQNISTYSWASLCGGISYFLDCATKANFRHIVLIEGPKVLGWEQWRQLEEKYSLGTLKGLLETFMAEGIVKRMDSDYLAKILFSCIIEAGTLIAHSPHGERARAEVSICLFTVLSGVCREQGDSSHLLPT